MSAQVVPVTSSPYQSIQAILAVNGSSLTLNLLVYYNTGGSFWVMDIADQFGNPLVSSVPLLTGVWPGGNILSFVDYLQIGACYLINTSGSATDIPDASNLGIGFSMIWDDNPSFVGGDNPS